MSRRHARARRPRGMVLIAVLWIVAALAVLVTGAARAVRDDARVASFSRQGVLAQALGDAAIELVLQQMAGLREPLKTLTVVNVAYRGVSIAVEIMPLNGLIDINNAPEPLLAALFQIAGGMPPGAGALLAAAALEVRSQKDSRGRPIGFEATEDLLRVPGLDYALYARITPLITADLRRGGGRVNPLAAPLDVLTVLAAGNVERARTLAAQRDAGRVGVDTTGLEASFIDGSASAVREFRLRARAPLPDGSAVLLGRTVAFENAAARYGLPWITIHNGRRKEVPG